MRNVFKIEIMNQRRINKHLRCPKCNSINTLSVRMYDNTRQYKCSDCGKYFTVKNNQKRRRVVVISDAHCGHVTGLTHPDYNTEGDIYADFREESWNWYARVVKSLFPINVLICNGDMIDGRQEKNGGSDLLVGDRLKQVDMAYRVIEEARPEQVFMTYGTPYHVGKDENFEELIAKRFNCGIYNNLRLDVNGCLFDVRHKIGRSNIPHGRYTALARQSMWADLMSGDRRKPTAIIRSHVHYFTCVMHSSNRMAMSTPALQGYSSYGAKECEGNVDYGISVFDIGEFGTIDGFKPMIATFETNIEPVIYSK